jgi:hypothetical protein
LHRAQLLARTLLLQGCSAEDIEETGTTPLFPIENATATKLLTTLLESCRMNIDEPDFYNYLLQISR